MSLKSSNGREINENILLTAT
uniref:HEAT repeat-containing protein 5B isoform X3 n=1 Tax=Rhizophora mucronata TaxID=61149 RepID=A0A2P2MKU9_RHIMU